GAGGRGGRGGGLDQRSSDPVAGPRVPGLRRQRRAGAGGGARDAGGDRRDQGGHRRRRAGRAHPAAGGGAGNGAPGGGRDRQGGGRPGGSHTGAGRVQPMSIDVESPATTKMPGFPRRFGPYVLVKPLARGGMGALYLALRGQAGMDKMCVIKTALPHLADRSYLQRFRDEAKVVVRLSHGNLVTVFDAGEVKSELFLAMDFIEGKDLRAVWNRCAQKGTAFPIPVAVHLIKE